MRSEATALRGPKEGFYFSRLTPLPQVNERLSGEGACELVKNDGAGKGWICIIRGGANGGGKKRKKDNGKGKREDKGKDNGVGGGGQPDTKKARTSK